MASRIKLKRSLTQNSVPTTSDLTDKEVALNITDRSLFVNNNGNIVEVLNADPNDEKIVPSMFSSAITDGVGNTWYVSTNGTDKATLGSVNPRHGETTGANSWGKTPTTSFASLKYALDNYAQSGDTVVIAAGTYTEVFPLTVPVGVTIKGDGLKSSFIQPSGGTNTEDAFLIEGDCNIEDLCIKGFLYDSVGDTGYAFRLKNTYTVSADGRRPYIQRVSVITTGSTTSGSDPRGFNAGDAGRGALVDGSSIGASSAEATLLFNECTFVVPNSVGLYLKNGARAEWLNSFTYFAADSIKGENPGGTGFKGTGKTRLKLNNITGTFNATDTITYYDTDGVTALASGTIDSNDGTYIYVTGQGTGEFAEATADTDGKAITVNGDAQLSTAQKQFGTASVLFDGTGDDLSLATSSDFGFGTGDFAVEAFIRPTAITVFDTLFDFRTANPEMALVISINSSGAIVVNANGSNVITGGSLSINTWAHVAVSRVSGTTSLFVNGSRVGSAYTDTNNYGSTKPLKIGRAYDGGNAFAGYIDEIRVSKGAARYANAGTITVPTAEFTPDVNTSLLIHANGLSGSTEIIDGGITSQDIRSSSGGTASFITLADYTDFGAELRSIGSASVYGTRGITASGKGVRLRCILHNFGYVGTDADSSNDISDVVQADEVIESGGGRVLFTSMDQNGDFRVGDAFFVDQERGTVSFAGGDSGSGTTFDQITVSGTGNTTTILPTSISVGNLQFTGDSVTNLSSNGIELGSTLELLDGASNSPSLTFINDNNVGLFRDTDYSEFGLDGNGDENPNDPLGSPLGLGFNDSRKLQIGREVNSLVNFNVSESSIATITVSAVGNNYPPGQHTVPTTGGAGSGAQLALLVSPFIGTITNRGSGYEPATTQSETITGGSGTGGLIDVEFFGLEDGSINGGSGYYAPAGGTQVYNNVDLQNGSGTAAQANLTVENGAVTVVDIVVHGTGYVQGDVLTANNADMLYTDPVTQQVLQSPGAGFQYTLTNTPGSVKQITPNTTPWTATVPYEVGDVISFTDSVGTGAGFQFTISDVGVPTAVGNTDGITLGAAGAGYNVGDVLTPTYSVDTTVPTPGDVWVEEVLGAFEYVTYNVLANPGVVDQPGNKYFIDFQDGNGSQEAPSFTVRRNTVYNFIFTDGSAGTHPIHFSTTQDGTHNGGTRLINGSPSGLPITRPHYDSNGILDGYQLIVTDELPSTLYYYCEIHPGMAGNTGGGNEASITVTGTFQSGASVAVATLSRSKIIEVKTSGELVVPTISSAIQVNTGLITSQNLTLLAQSGVGGDLNMDGNLIVGGDATVRGDLNVEGTSEFSANVGGAGEISIGDADADVVNLRGDIVLNGVYGTATPPATLGPLEGANFMLDASTNKIGINQHQPEYDLDITGVLHNTGDAFLASTAGDTLHVGRDPVSYVHNPEVTLDVSGDAEITGHIVIQDGDEADPAIRFAATGAEHGIFSHVVTGTTQGVSFTNISGRMFEINPGELKSYRNMDFIYEKIDETTLTGGSGYVNGLYPNVAATGGNGTGLLYDLTVAFETSITNAGAGYDDADYLGVTLSSITSATAGALQTFTITNGGLNYVDGTYTNVALTGGTGSNGTANVTVAGGTVTIATAATVGTNYTQGDTLSIATNLIGGSKLETLTVTNGGSGYTDGTYLSVPLVTSSGSGTNATGNITVSGGVVTAATVQAQGGGYTTSDALTVDADDITIAVLASANITNGGSSYTNGSYTAVATVQTNTRDGLAGAGATFDITVSGNAVTAVTLVDGGTNYQVGDTLTVASGDIGGDAGEISGVTVTNGGSGYTDATYTNVNITGGSGSNAVAEISINGGVIDSVTITNGGTGYVAGETVGLAGYGGASLTIDNVVSASGFELTVATITVGSGLVLTPATVITGSGLSLTAASVASGTGGSGGEADIKVENGVVTEVTVTNAGTGFSIGDTIRVNDADMQYDDGSGQLVASAPPTTQMVLTINTLGAVTVANITDSGEGYKVNDVLTNPPVNLGGQGGGFELQVNTLEIETTVSIDEKEGSITVKELDATEFTIGSALALTASGISKIVAGNLLLSTQTDSYVQIGGNQALIIPSGNSAAQPVGVAGMIRFNSEVSQFEGFNGTSFVSLGGVRDVDLDTFVTAEATTAADDDTFRFFNENVRTITLTKDKYILNNADEIDYTDLDNVSLWVEGTTVVSPYAATNFVPDATTVDTSANTITLTAHNLTEGVIVTYAATGGTVIGGLGDGTNYHVHVVDENTIQLAADETNLGNGVYLPLSGTSTDPQHTFTPVAESVIDILYYYEDRVYSIQTSGTFDAAAANFPTHTTGTATNGTVDLEYERNAYSSPVVRANTINHIVENLQINTGALNLKGDTTAGLIETAAPDLKVQFDNAGTVEQFLKLSRGGTLSVNTDYGTGETYKEILDYQLQTLTLVDTQIATSTGTLDTSVGPAAAVTFGAYTDSCSGKFMVEIKDNSATQRRQYSEVSYLVSADGNDIYYTENNKLYTDVVLCDVTVDIVSNNIQVNINDATSSSTTVYTIKVVNHNIQA